MEFKLGIIANYKKLLEKSFSSPFSTVLKSLIVVTYKMALFLKHELQIIN